MWTDPGWFINKLEDRIWFWSSAAWPKTSCTWAFPLCNLVLYGELIPLSNKPLVSIKPPPPSNGLEINKPPPPPPGRLNKGFTVTVEFFELTAASDLDDVKFGSSLPVFFCCYRLVLALTRRAFCHWDKQNSFKENLPMSSDIYPFSNLKASFIIFYVNWNIAIVALDCDLLTTF